MTGPEGGSIEGEVKQPKLSSGPKKWAEDAFNKIADIADRAIHNKSTAKVGESIGGNYAGQANGEGFKGAGKEYADRVMNNAAPKIGNNIKNRVQQMEDVN